MGFFWKSNKKWFQGDPSKFGKSSIRDRSTRTCVRSRVATSACCDDSWKVAWVQHGFLAKDRAFDSKKNELRSFSSAQERLLFVCERSNYDRPHICAYVSANWQSILMVVLLFKAQRRDLSSSVFIVVVGGVLTELLLFESKSGIFWSGTHFCGW